MVGKLWRLLWASLVRYGVTLDVMVHLVCRKASPLVHATQPVLAMVGEADDVMHGHTQNVAQRHSFLSAPKKLEPRYCL